MSQERKLFLIMTGGVGCESLMGLCDAFTRMSDGRMLAYVLTGRNEGMRRQIEERYGAAGKIRLIVHTSALVR